MPPEVHHQRMQALDRYSLINDRRGQLPGCTSFPVPPFAALGGTRQSKSRKEEEHYISRAALAPDVRSRFAAGRSAKFQMRCPSRRRLVAAELAPSESARLPGHQPAPPE